MQIMQVRTLRTMHHSCIGGNTTQDSHVQYRQQSMTVQWLQLSLNAKACLAVHQAVMVLIFDFQR